MSRVIRFRPANRVFFYDVESKLALGNATPIRALNGLLEVADVVTLHVPEAAETKNMIGERELARMRQGAALINASRGSVVDIDALVEALECGRLSGAALDVFPTAQGHRRHIARPYRRALTQSQGHSRAGP